MSALDGFSFLHKSPQEEAQLLVPGDVIKALRDGVHRYLLRRYFDFDGVVHVLHSKFTHPAGERCAGETWFVGG